MKIRAAVLEAMGAAHPYADSRPLKIEELDLAPPGTGEILVRIKAAGLCHSDLSVINGDRPRPMPMALGHEAAGIVEQVGDGVNDLAIGDHVVLVFVPSCGHCHPCAEGRPALCEPGAAANGAGTLLNGARRLTRNGQMIHHHLGCSAFATHAVVSRRSAIKIDRELPLQEAALFGCAVLTGVGAVVNTAQVRAGSSVAVVGLGGVGLASVLGAAAAGARQVIAVDLARRQADSWRKRSAPRTHSTPAPPTSSRRFAMRPAAASTLRSKWRARHVRSISPIGSRAVAARRLPQACHRPTQRGRCRPSIWLPKSERSRAAMWVLACHCAISRATSISIAVGACRSIGC